MTATPGPGGSDPRAELAATAVRLAARMPAEQSELLALARFEAERAALARLADPAWAGLGAETCTPAEAGRLLDLIRSRYARLPRSGAGGAAGGSEPAGASAGDPAHGQDQREEPV